MTKEWRHALETHTGRLPHLAPPALEPEQLAVYEEIAHGPRASPAQPFPLLDQDSALVGPFNAMVVAPHVGLHLQRLGTAIRYESTLPAAARELAILLCARAERSEFEWYAHAPIAVAAGVPEAVIEAILAGETLSLSDATEAAVVSVSTSLLETGDVPDHVYRAVSMVLTEIQLVELVVLVGYYRLLSRLLSVFRVPLPPGATCPFADEGDGGPPTASPAG